MKNDIEEKIKQYLTYEKNTGYVYWKNKTNRKIKIGSRAGIHINHGYFVLRIFKTKEEAHQKYLSELEALK